jgi:ABC-2 type transport system permease protein
MNTHSPMNTTIWLVRREFWENRAFWIIPLVIGGFMTLAALFGKIDFPDLQAMPAQFPTRAVGQAFLVAVGATFFVVMAIYSTWYLLDCLYADRKDRSVLFWKSMPISDTMTVLSKLGTALIVIPVLYCAAADLTTLLVAFIISVRASSVIGGALWHADLWLQMQALWLYLIVITAVWYLPIAAYLLVVSAWAKRAVMLWSILPPIALMLAEKWFFGTHAIARQLWERFVGVAGLAFNGNPGDASWVVTTLDNKIIRTPASIWSFLNISGFFSSLETWIGVAVGTALIVGAIQLRMRRTEI